MTPPEARKDDDRPFRPGRAIVAALAEARELLEEQIEAAGIEARQEWEEIEELAEAGLRHARRVMIFVVGMTVVLLGVVLLLTPGPGTLVILGGLSILAVEFAWARRWRIRLEKTAADALVRLRESLEILDGDDEDEVDALDLSAVDASGPSEARMTEPKPGRD